MDQHPFDDTATDALLDGKVSPAQAPEGLQHVAALIHLAQAPATTDRAAERQVVSEMGAIVRGGGSGVAASRFAAHRARLATVAAVAGLVVLSGGAVAAAAGALPNPVQRVVASGFSNVGISMPTPTTGARPTTTVAPPTTTRHPAATLAGLCVAYRAASRNPTAAAHQARATAFVRLAEAAKAHHESVAAYCTHVLAARKPAHHAAPPTTRRPPTSVPDKGKGKGKPEHPSGTHHPSSPPPPGKGHDGHDGHDSGSDGHHGSGGPPTVPESHGGSSHGDGGGHSSGSGGGSSGSGGHH
jgi:uncharacterized membrane protein YgcG